MQSVIIIYAVSVFVLSNGRLCMAYMYIALNILINGMCIFCIWLQCVWITHNELFWVAPDCKKYVDMLINVAWIIF